MKEVDEEYEDEADEEAEAAEGGDQQKFKKADPVWEEFVRVLWNYQYLRTPQPLKKNLLADKRARALYEESQGITGVAVTLYFLAQRRAIVGGGDERLRAGTIRTVAAENQHLIKPMLDSMKAGVMCGPYVVPDLVEQPLQIVPSKAPAGDSGDTTPDGEKGAQVKPHVETAASETPSQAVADDTGKSTGQQNGGRAATKGGRSKKAPPPAYGKGDLRNVASRVADGASVGDALDQIGRVRPEDESSGGGAGG